MGEQPALQEAQLPQQRARREGITRVAVSGFKSISQRQEIEIRPLTLLAGVNSSGKSSMMQPLLLLKQTLEASYDPGPLLLNGPNAKFTSAEQVLSCVGKSKRTDGFQVQVGGMFFDVHAGYRFFDTTFDFGHQPGKGFEIRRTVYADEVREITLRPGMTRGEIVAEIAEAEYDESWAILRERCFLKAMLWPN